MREEYVGWLDDEWNVVLDHDQPIVRCRDCKRHIEANSLTGWNDVCNLTDSNVQPNGFCAWASPREEGE